MPPTPLARRLSLQSVLFAVGQGTFITGSAVFFTQIVGLSASQVGLGLTIGGVAAFMAAVPLGKAADRVGGKRAWVIGAFGAALMFLVWPLVTGLAEYIAMTIVMQLFENFAGAGRGAYTIDVFPREERVRSQAFMRSALNIGFTLGALIGGVALAFNNNDVIRFVPLLTAVLSLANAAFVLRLPEVAHGNTVATSGAEPRPPDKRPLDKSRSALRNRGFVALMGCDGVLSSNQVLLNVLIPLWLVQETDAPRVLLAWLFGTNTVLAVLLQVRAARGVDTVDRALQAARRSCAFFVLSCLIVLVTHDTVGWVTILLVWVGHVTVTGAELFQSAGHWGLFTELSDPDRRGEYVGAAQLGGTLGDVWAPAVYTFLAISWGPLGWLTIAAIVVLATLGMTPAARSAERFLAAAPDRQLEPEARPA
jgi:MFS family permease